jgi:hypothetical protein
MAVVNFVPEIWAATLLESLKKALVYGMVVNRNYEGEISEKGDTVNITSISRPTIATYVPGTTVITPESLTDAQRKLIVDQAKFFAFEVDDVEQRQAAGDVLDAAMGEAAYGLADVADQYLASLYTGVIAANALGTIAVVAATPTNAYDLVLVPLKVKLDEANVPQEDRWCVIPPWFHGRMLRDDRFIRADASGDATAKSITGFVGEAAGFSLFTSNNTPFPGGDDNIVIAGYKGAITFAEQINKVEAYRPQDAFSDAVKGLYLYGGKLVRPDAIATCQASQT